MVTSFLFKQSLLQVDDDMLQNYCSNVAVPVVTVMKLVVKVMKHYKTEWLTGYFARL